MSAGSLCRVCHFDYSRTECADPKCRLFKGEVSRAATVASSPTLHEFFNLPPEMRIERLDHLHGWSVCIGSTEVAYIPAGEAREIKAEHWATFCRWLKP